MGLPHLPPLAEVVRRDYPCHGGYGMHINTCTDITISN
jgi:hypothetical protein